MRSTDEQHWQIGELARATGLTVRALHHYDELGLLVPSERTFAGYRLYGEADVQRLYRILALRGLGLRLEAIAGLLDEGGPGLREVLDRQLEEVELQLTETRRLRERLTAIREALGADGEPSIDQLINTMEAMTMQHKYYNDDQLERIKRRGEELGGPAINAVEREWDEIFAALRAEMQAGTDPGDARLEPHRQRARELVRAFTGGDADIAQSLGKMWANEDQETLSHGMVDRDLWDYYTRMCQAPGNAVS